MSNVPKYVIVSDFYYGKGWYDAKSEMWFNKSDGVIEIPEDVDTGNIVKYLRFNYLKEVRPSTETKKALKEAEQLAPATPKQLMREAYNKIEVTDETETLKAKDKEVVKDITTKESAATEVKDAKEDTTKKEPIVDVKTEEKKETKADAPKKVTAKKKPTKKAGTVKKKQE